MTDDRLYTELQPVRRDRRRRDARRSSKDAERSASCSTIRGRPTRCRPRLSNLEEMTQRINAGEGSLGRLVKDEAFAQSLTGATENLRT